MVIVTSSKPELRKKTSKARQLEQCTEKNSKKLKIQSAKPVPTTTTKKVKNQPKEQATEKLLQKKKSCSLDATNIDKKAKPKKAKSSTELRQKASSVSMATTKSATTKKPKQTMNSTITTSKPTVTTSVKKREQTKPKPQITQTTDKKSPTKKLKKKPSLQTPSLPVQKKLVPSHQPISIATSTSHGVDMSTQTDPMEENTMAKQAYFDIRHLVPSNALQITLEELMSTIQVSESQKEILATKKKQATIKSKIRQALKSIKF